MSAPDWVEKLTDAPVRRGRPKAEVRKVSTTIRLDADVLEHFRAEEPRWQSRVNAVPRNAIKR